MAGMRSAGGDDRDRLRRPSPRPCVGSGSLSITWVITTRNSPAMEPSPGLYVVSSYVPSAAISPPAALPAWLPSGMNEIEPPPTIGLPSNVTFPWTG